MEPATSQPFIFIITIYGGMTAGAVYDVFRAIRRAMRGGRWLAALTDTLFILALGIIAVFTLYTANLGELRLYTFLGFALGFALYISGIAPFVAYVAARIRAKKTGEQKKQPQKKGTRD